MDDQESQSAAPWYKDGLAFECTRCGACCTGAPGYVWVTQAEIVRLAEYCGDSVEQFTRKYIRLVGSRVSLIEKPGGDCIFWDKKAGCTVYPARPVQCQTWPFWPENIESHDDWKRVQRGCPGAGRGQVFTVEQIQAAAAKVGS